MTSDEDFSIESFAKYAFLREISQNRPDVFVCYRHEWVKMCMMLALSSDLGVGKKFVCIQGKLGHLVANKRAFDEDETYVDHLHVFPML